jgi:hypothetical protein
MRKSRNNIRRRRVSKHRSMYGGRPGPNVQKIRETFHRDHPVQDSHHELYEVASAADNLADEIRRQQVPDASYAGMQLIRILQHQFEDIQKKFEEMFERATLRERLLGFPNPYREEPGPKVSETFHRDHPVQDSHHELYEVASAAGLLWLFAKQRNGRSPQAADASHAGMQLIRILHLQTEDAKKKFEALMGISIS